MTTTVRRIPTTFFIAFPAIISFFFFARVKDTTGLCTGPSFLLTKLFAIIDIFGAPKYTKYVQDNRNYGGPEGRAMCYALLIQRRSDITWTFANYDLLMTFQAKLLFVFADSAVVANVLHQPPSKVGRRNHESVL